jgi:hypothetical protein
MMQVPRLVDMHALRLETRRLLRLVQVSAWGGQHNTIYAAAVAGDVEYCMAHIYLL